MRYARINPIHPNFGWITLDPLDKHQPLDTTMACSQPGWTYVMSPKDWLACNDLVWSRADEKYVKASSLFDTALNVIDALAGHSVAVAFAKPNTEAYSQLELAGWSDDGEQPGGWHRMVWR